MTTTALEPPADLDTQVQRALAEDLGTGDLTASLIAAEAVGRGRIIARQPAVVCGTAWVEAVFRQVAADIASSWTCQDGDRVCADTVLCHLEGPARGILTGERTALNFLQTLSATATRTRQFVDASAGTSARILDTRKTLPGLRTAQKYAVACGGGYNHRLGLFDGILIKENHIRSAGSITAAVTAAHSRYPDVPIEVETENLEELQEALATPAVRIMLDNYSLAALRRAVELTAGRCALEASGNVSLENVHAIAATGVDFISIGSLTKDITAVDLSLQLTLA